MVIEVGDSNLICLSSTLFAPIGVKVIFGFFEVFNFYSFLGEAVSFMVPVMPFIVIDFLRPTEFGEFPIAFEDGGYFYGEFNS